MADVTFQMPDGTSRTATVDDGIKELPQDQQVALVGRMREAALAQQAPQKTAPTFTGDIQGGLHDLGTSASQGLKVAGGIASRNGLPTLGGYANSAADTVANYTPNAPTGQDPSGQLADAIRSKDYSAIPGLALHSALRAAPSAAPILAAGSVGGPIAAAAMAGGMAVGPEAYARAANNGRSEPTTSDAVQALPGVAGEALGGALLPGGSKSASLLVRAGKKVASEAAGGAIMDTAGQLGATVGTDKGASLDPYQVAASGLTQGTIGAGRVAKEAAGSVASGAAKAVGMAAPDPANLDQAATTSRVNEAISQAQAGAKATTGRDITPAEAANSVRKDVTSSFQEFGRALRDNGTLSPEEFRTTFQPLFEQVSRHNASPFSTPEGSSAYDRLQKSLSNSPDLLKRLDEFSTDLDTLSSAARNNRMTGALERVGRAVGNVAGVGAGAFYGGLPGMIGAIAGHNIPASIGAKVGAMADQALGWQKPLVVQQAEAASQMLQKAGRDPGLNPMANISSMLEQARNTPNPVMGDAPAPITPSQVGMKDAARNQAALVTRYGPDHPVGSAALDALSSADPNMAERSMANWNAMAPVRDAKATADRKAQASQAEAAQSAKDSEFLARTASQQKKSDLEAALGRTSRTTAAADKAANRNEDTLQTADVQPNVPDASLTAINAAMNQAQRKANAVKAAGGDNRLGASQEPQEAPQPPPAPTPTAPTVEPAQPTSSGLLPMGSYLQHVAMAQHGTAITPDHISAGLDKLASRGGLTPDQYEFYKGSLGGPLQNPGGIHNAVMDAITAHAVGAARDGDAPTTSPIVAAAMARGKAQTASNQSGVRNQSSYDANIQQGHRVEEAIRKAHPELSDVVNQITGRSAKDKTAASREDALRAHLDTIDDPAEKSRQAKILKPLTAFGKK